MNLGASYSPSGSFVSRQETCYLNGLCIQDMIESVTENRIHFRDWDGSFLCVNFTGLQGTQTLAKHYSGYVCEGVSRRD